MATIKSKLKTYIIGKPSLIPANSVDVDFEELTLEIDRLGQVIGTQEAVGAASEPTAKVIRKLSTQKGKLESLVVNMNDEVKNVLNERHKGAIIIELDDALYPLGPSGNEREGLPLIQNVVLTAESESVVVKIVVKGSQGELVSKAHVTVAGLLWVDSGFTNTKGQVKLTLLGETEESISSIDIKPAHTYWSLHIDQPAIAAGEDNEVVLKKIGPSVSSNGNTDEKQFVGWGQQDMGLIGQPQQLKPVKIAVIDSGISGVHPDLSPSRGFDFGDTPDGTTSWQKDGSGHGTHVSGICAAQDNTFGILGFAPNAELIVLRIFPNASNSKLMEALDWCLDNDVDVVNMSLGGKNGSELVRQRIQACRENGLLPVAAAGNSGGDVLFPAAFSEVLAVAAIGRFGTFPDDSSHYKHIGENPVQSGKYFSPQFTCRGPEIDVCAPGVAITSCVPGAGYAAWDGTSMACPHVAGLAGRLLQMRDDIRDKPRRGERSQNLFDAIIETCTFIEGIPEIYQGKGMPGLSTGGGTTEDSALREVAKLIDSAIKIVETKLVKV
ncbi:MAG: hypothetical protein BA863_06120 [Desulfovibrio sp. S3730MH75]|nr:MAG: hypothetical protein BA863_06120 [Desulfovibrio sp. S3730MH75]